MAEENNLKLDGLEFFDIKQNLKAYMKGQSQFQDYNFDASGMSTLLDLLSYNTYYNMFYTNMAFNEAFIETAQKRSSVVNLAAALGYTPRSTTSAQIKGSLTVSVNGTAFGNVTVPYGTRFSSVVDGVTYYFVNLEPITIFPSNGIYSTDSITLTEGIITTESYVYDVNNPNQKFLLNNSEADISTLVVKTELSSTNATSQGWTRSDQIVNLNRESYAYYIKETDDGKYEVKFGDGLISQALADGNVIKLTYVVSKGAAGNGILNLSLMSDPSNLQVSGASIVAASFVASQFSLGGQDRESIETIRFNAPRANTAQNRAVTAEDFQTILVNQPNVDSVLVWGGEDNDPPAYGKVFIAVRPTIGEVLTETEKLNLINGVINPKKSLTVSTEIVDAEFIYVSVDINASYDPEKIIASEASLKETIFNTVKTYNTEKLNKFSRYFRYSELVRLIDYSDRSILSSDITVRMKKRFSVQLGSSVQYIINFSNPIQNTTADRPSTHPFGAGNQVTSTAFSYGGYDNCFLEENGGIMRIYRVSAEGVIIGVAQNVGSINYNSGQIILDDFKPTAIAAGGVTLELIANPASRDILPLRGQIVNIRNGDIRVAVTNDKDISLTRR